MGGASWMALGELKQQMGADVVQPLLYGTACFLLAALISAHKAGAFGRLMLRRGGDGVNDGD